jgi:hypothetical protein
MIKLGSLLGLLNLPPCGRASLAIRRIAELVVVKRVRGK